MKKLVFDYEMKLSFSSPVTDHRFQLRCIPATGPRQQVIDVAVKIEPDVELETTIDSFDSVVMTGFIPEPHTMFNYSVTGIAFVDNAHIKSEIYKPLYRFNSALTVPGPAIEALIGICRERIASLPADCTPIDQAREVMDEVFKTFVYTPASTTIRTTAEEAFAQRKGVCVYARFHHDSHHRRTGLGSAQGRMPGLCARHAVRVPARRTHCPIHRGIARRRGRHARMGRNLP